MTLKEFIKESLASIVDAVSESQAEMSERSIINPSLSKDGYLNFGMGGKQKIIDVHFDVAVTTDETEGVNKGISIFSGVFGAGLASSEKQTNASSSRIQFSIPVVLPVNDTLAKRTTGINKMSY